MRKRVLLLSSEVELRARFACGLQSAGYAVELACDEKRALKLAADDNFNVAIVATREHRQPSQHASFALDVLGPRTFRVEEVEPDARKRCVSQSPPWER